MASIRFGDRADRVSGKAKQWAGRASGNSRLQWKGRAQSGLAGAKIGFRDLVKRAAKAVRARRGR
jgi:uncharacterized protein YjbJ (UPF0337 family)